MGSHSFKAGLCFLTFRQQQIGGWGISNNKRLHSSWYFQLMNFILLKSQKKETPQMFLI